MPPKDDLIRLQHMLDAAVEIIGFVEGCERSDLEKNRMLTQAIVRDIEVIGEAAGKVSLDTQNSIPAIPWPSIIGMRNRLIHGYFEVDLDRVWDTVIDDLPFLVGELRKIIKK